jgi:hypothetical protein
MICAVILIASVSALGADTLRVEETDRVGRRIDNRYFTADLSSRLSRGQEEDSGTLRALTYKPFGVTLLRTQNRMHWAPNLSRVDLGGYQGLGTWHPVQEFRERQTVDEYVHYREGYLPNHPELKIEAEYRFLPGVPYFLFWSRLTVEKSFAVRMVRDNQMTMDDFFTHVAWPGHDGTPRLAAFDERHDLLRDEPIAFEAPWLAFLNLEKGYGYGFVMLESRATKKSSPGIGISDGSNPSGKYWSRRIISGGADGGQTPLVPGDQFEERTAYVLFRCSKDEPLDELFVWEEEIRRRFGSTTR